MLPATNGLLNADLLLHDQPSATFSLDIERQCITGFTDGVEAMKQAIYLALGTERFRHAIFSWNYGAELDGLIGRPYAYALPELQRRITEALLQDTRITSVGDFNHQSNKNAVYTTFTVTTIFGPIPVEKAVLI